MITVIKIVYVTLYLHEQNIKIQIIILATIDFELFKLKFTILCRI